MKEKELFEENKCNNFYISDRGVYSSGTFDSFPPLPLGALILFPLQKIFNLARTEELLYIWSKEILNA